MKTNYLGLSCTGHDNAIAIVDSSGNLVFAEATERYLQSKRSLSYSPEDMIRTDELIDKYCEPNADLVIAKTWSAGAESWLASTQVEAKRMLERLSDPDLEPVAESIRVASIWTSLLEKSIPRAGEWIQYRFASKRKPNVATIRAYDHHLTHAATGCFGSPFDDAACAIIDGYGEGTTSDCYRFRRSEGLRSIRSGASTGSLGGYYADLCTWCGFDFTAGEEWKVMGLAAYGKRDPEIYEVLANLIRVDGLRFTNDATSMRARLDIQRFIRKPGAPAMTVADLAHTGQLVFSELVIQLLNNLYDVEPAQNLVLGGGCALNSSCNGTILAKTKFKNLYIPSAPADDGNAIGAALLAYYEDHPEEHRRAELQTPYLGSIISDQRLDQLQRFRGPLRSTSLGGDVSKVSQLLADGKIIGWVQGRAEFGPRALGNRSILADARPAGMREKINAVVKLREEFRPLAPSILHEHGSEYFIDYQESPYMERTLRFRPEVKDKVPAVVHVDGTGRLQTVKREWNPMYYDLIHSFFELTGVPLVLNTSFNVMGKPIIHSIEDAIAVFFTSGLDALVIGDCLFEK